MQLKPEQIASFKTLFKQKFNVELSEKEALEMGLKLVSLMKTILLSNQKKW